MMRFFIPVRGIHTSKSRLRASIDMAEVDRVSELLLRRTLSAIPANEIAVTILTSDPTLAKSLRNEGFSVLEDDGSSLNKALKLAATQFPSDSYALLMPDLPTINTDSLDKLLAVHEIHPYIVCAASDGGTSACILPPSVFLAGLFGPDSSEKIMQMAAATTIPVAQMIIQDLHRDLDTPEEYTYFMQRGLL